jgi:hypothetical protein
MRGRKFPQKQKAEAVGIAAVTSIAEASRQTGIPEPTIHAWFHSPEYEELRTRNKEAVGEEWWAGVQKAFRRTFELLDQTEDPVKAATAGAIVFDKLALSRGDVTSRSEVSTFHGYNDHEKRAIADLLRKALAPDGAPATDAGDAVGDAVVGAGEAGATSA